MKQSPPHNYACERQIVDCLLQEAPRVTVDPAWFWSDMLGWLARASLILWDGKHFQPPRTRSALEQVATGNENALRLGRVLTRLGLWDYPKSLRRAIKSCRHSAGNPLLLDFYCRQVHRAWELRTEIDRCEARIRAAYAELAPAMAT